MELLEFFFIISHNILLILIILNLLDIKLSYTAIPLVIYTLMRFVFYLTIKVTGEFDNAYNLIIITIRTFYTI